MPFLHPTRTRGLLVPVDVSLYGVTSSPNVTSCIVSPFGISYSVGLHYWTGTLYHGQSIEVDYLQ